MRIRIMTSGTKEIYPSCRISWSPVRPFPRASANPWSVQFSPRRGRRANDICSRRILRRFPRRYNTLKRLECVYYSICPRIRLADPFRLHAIIRTLPQRNLLGGQLVSLSHVHSANRRIHVRLLTSRVIRAAQEQQVRLASSQP